MFPIKGSFSYKNFAESHVVIFNLGLNRGGRWWNQGGKGECLVSASSEYVQRYGCWNPQERVGAEWKTSKWMKDVLGTKSDSSIALFLLQMGCGLPWRGLNIDWLQCKGLWKDPTSQREHIWNKIWEWSRANKCNHKRTESRDSIGPDML